jgi:ABC-type uncharacterized transport system substrate-binding protein
MLVLIKTLFILILPLYLASCAKMELLTPPSAAPSKVLIVNTNASVERYQTAEASFLPLLGDQELETVDLGGVREPVELLQDLLNTESYQAIYCIGAKALGSLDYIGLDTPLVYSSVLNWRRFESRKAHHGVASELSLKAQLTWFKYFFPELERVGVIYSENNEALILEAMQVAKGLNMTLVAEKAVLASDVRAGAEKLLSDVQALWLISDLAVLSSELRVEQLFKMAKTKRVPVLSYNELFIDMGALLSISADLPTTGRQAALLMRDLLLNESQVESIVYPAGSRIVLNQAALQSSDLILNEDALDSLSDIRY